MKITKDMTIGQILNEDEKIQEHTLEHISINPRMEPQLIEQSAPLTPTVTELE